MWKQIGSLLISGIILISLFLFIAQRFLSLENHPDEKIETKTVWVDAKNSHYAVDKKTWNYSEYEVKVNGKGLTEKVQSVIDSLNLNGYTIAEITPIASAIWDYSGNGGYGYSYTDGVIITAEKKTLSFHIFGN